MNTLEKIVLLLTAVREDPDNFEKQACYFKALTDARLDDFYKVYDDYESWKARAEKAEADYAKLCHAVVGANCHVDHAIETLAEERKQATMMYSALAAIEYGNELDWLKAHPNVRTTFDASSRRVAAIARANVFLREGGE